jgi:energy-coupling factor transport system ATP-binding protein
MPITAKKASYIYPSTSSPALDSIDLTVEAGEIVAMAGSSGSGKTTLAKLISGLVPPTSGEVVIDGLSTSSRGDELGIRKRVGLFFQNPDEQIVCQTVEREIAFTLENLGMESKLVRSKVNSALAQFDIDTLAGREPSALSGGERALVALASIIVAEPCYLILDEPTSLLDANGKDVFYSMLGSLVESGLGVVMLTQYADEALIADRLIVLRHGRKTYDGNTKSLLLDDEPEQYGFWKPAIRRAAEEIGVWEEVKASYVSGEHLF